MTPLSTLTSFVETGLDPGTGLKSKPAFWADSIPRLDEATIAVLYAGANQAKPRFHLVSPCPTNSPES